jgi:hypothetical protein
LIFSKSHLGLKTEGASTTNHEDRRDSKISLHLLLCDQKTQLSTVQYSTLYRQQGCVAKSDDALFRAKQTSTKHHSSFTRRFLTCHILFLDTGYNQIVYSRLLCKVNLLPESIADYKNNHNQTKDRAKNDSNKNSRMNEASRAICCCVSVCAPLSSIRFQRLVCWTRLACSVERPFN